MCKFSLKTAFRLKPKLKSATTLEEKPCSQQRQRWMSTMTSDMHTARQSPSGSERVGWGANVERLEKLELYWIKGKSAPTGLPGEVKQKDLRKRKRGQTSASYDKTGSRAEGPSAAWDIVSWNSLAESHRKQTQPDDGNNITLSNGLCHRARRVYVIMPLTISGCG